MINTNGMVHDISGDYPLVIDITDGVAEFYFEVNDTFFLVAHISVSDLLMAIINTEHPDEGTIN